METRASKKMKQKSELQERNSRRRVSDLPDELLRHIFSLLPFKSIVQTSVLSKHWNHLSLWRSHPHLDFSHPSLDSTAMDFIPSVLSRRQPNSNIITFRLSGLVSFSCLLDCVELVMEQGIEELELDVHLDCVVSLPPSLFSCNTLRVLTLNHQNPYPIFRASCPVILAVKVSYTRASLPSVHTLCLTNIWLNASSDVLSGSNFPLLRKLCLKGSVGMSALNINCPGLEILELEGSLNTLDISCIEFVHTEVRN